MAEWPDGVGRHILPRCDSTNAEALRLAPNLSNPAWIMTREQVAGRGRRGRAWVSGLRNFAASLALRPVGPPAQVAQLSFVAALALHEALAQVAGPSARLALKWPNDVLLNGGKVAGILLESAGRGPQVDALALGIGVNLASAPDAAALEPGALRPVSLAAETGANVSPDDFLDLLAPAFAGWQAVHAAQGFAPIRQAWLARAARLGEQITARTGATEQTGIFEGIDPDGALILTTAAGRSVIAAADVHFPKG
ncbi:MAG: biotin--[acetyl-CoA-carboxylase] ligase [Paracoccus sp. (in: a-proteobacteria)]|uniref:biotin--[acetyl-CoA-carboxylase] ligase n=1 Tax=Paracoccus sp. TaxID=267 RepID=UPI0026E0DA11|nr:biotin--[acetyl-CoA-carboxylase] ligase [Paracoccus sp. (in: a-proteobacteria)]MDO5622536.1 biotin--[acetyl-CoA-carboxylase] ligase [Paracoccus sp. (in: a-proteobacteria)]